MNRYMSFAVKLDRILSEMKNSDKVRSYDDFIRDLKLAVDGYGDIEEIGTIDNSELLKIVLNPKGKKTLALIAGIHGDEPGGPLGILSFLEDKSQIPENIRIVIIPVVNPNGFEFDKRRNKDNKDINRNFVDGKITDEGELVLQALKNEKIELAITMHEDPDAKQFYLYHIKHKKLANDIRDVASKYFEINDGPRMRKDKGKDGLVPPPHVRSNSLEDKFTEIGIPYLTTEPPGTEPLEKRIEFMKETIKLAMRHI